MSDSAPVAKDAIIVMERGTLDVFFSCHRAMGSTGVVADFFDK
jgi:hypothetical protein